MSSVDPNQSILQSYFVEIHPKEKDKISWFQRRLVVVKNQDGIERLDYKHLNPIERIGALFGGRASLKKVVEFCNTHKIQSHELSIKVSEYNLLHPKNKINYVASFENEATTPSSSSRLSNIELQETPLNIVTPYVSPELTEDEVQKISHEPRYDWEVLLNHAISKFVKFANPVLKERYQDWFSNNGAQFRKVFSFSPNFPTPFYQFLTQPFLIRVILQVLPDIPRSEWSSQNLYKLMDRYTTNCLQLQLDNLHNQGISPPSSIKEEDLKKLAKTFCCQIARKIITARKIISDDTESVVYDSKNKTVVEDWEHYFGDYEEAKFLLNICKDFIIEKPVIIEGKELREYSFANPNLRDYFQAGGF